ncbi:MAG: hypothetical protein AB1578_23230 [Thermodesulfobacteriota bacterium]
MDVRDRQALNTDPLARRLARALDRRLLALKVRRTWEDLQAEAGATWAVDATAARHGVSPRSVWRALRETRPQRARK